jgi:hypothetical protein
MGIAKLAVLGESGDKRFRVTTVPGVDVAAYDLGGFHKVVAWQLPRLASRMKWIERFVSGRVVYQSRKPRYIPGA